MTGRAASAIRLLTSGAGSVEVIGDGALAKELRELLGTRIWRAAHQGRPSAVIETTGDASALEGALERVEDLGTIVLAGPLPERPIALDLYSDVHVRGLTLVGVAPDDG